MPHIDQDGSGNIVVNGIINDAIWFDKVGANYVPRYFIKDTLVADTANKQFIHTDLEE